MTIRFSWSVKWPHMLKEEVQLWVAARVDCNLKQRPEDILKHFLEVGQLSLRMVDITVRGEHKQIIIIIKKKSLIHHCCTDLMSQIFTKTSGCLETYRNLFYDRLSSQFIYLDEAI